MTDEIYEKAIELKQRINTISEIQSVLANAKSHETGDNRYLAAIEATKFSPSGIIVEECKVHNHIKVPYDIMEKLEGVLWDEYHKTCKDFEEL